MFHATQLPYRVISATLIFSPNNNISLIIQPCQPAITENPHLYFDVNLIITLNLLNAKGDQGVQPSVLATTSSVYGKNETVC